MKKYVASILLLYFTFAVFGQVKLSEHKLNPEHRCKVDQNKAPFQYICQLFVKRNWGGFLSTGFYIGKKMIVAAGHSIGEYRSIFKNKVSYIEIRFFDYSECCQKNKLVAHIKLKKGDLEKIISHPNFKGRALESRPYDYGLIKLKSDTLEKLFTSSFKLGEFTNINVPSEQVHITGFSGDKQKENGTSLWDRWDLKSNITESANYLTYGMYTHDGDSGAPMWIERDGEFYVVGIHNTKFKNCNGGTKVTKNVLDYINGQ